MLFTSATNAKAWMPRLLHLERVRRVVALERCDRLAVGELPPDRLAGLDQVVGGAHGHRGVPWKIAAFFTASGNSSANHRAAPTPV